MIEVSVVIDGKAHPAYALRSGQRIIETVYDHEAQTMTVKVDNPAVTVGWHQRTATKWTDNGVVFEDWGHADCYICEEARRRDAARATVGTTTKGEHL